jgi:hypothetical protein
VDNKLFAVFLADDFLTYDDRGVTADLVNSFEVFDETQLSVMAVDGPGTFQIWCCYLW